MIYILLYIYIWLYDLYDIPIIIYDYMIYIYIWINHGSSQWDAQKPSPTPSSGLRRPALFPLEFSSPPGGTTWRLAATAPPKGKGSETTKCIEGTSIKYMSYMII